MSNHLLLSTLTFLTGTLLSSCSHPNPVTTELVTETETSSPATKFPYGGKVDSLNGIPGHRFGEALSTFSDALPLGGADVTGQVTYRLPDKSPYQSPWFAKHREEVPGIFYHFKAGKFVKFEAVAYDPAGQQALAGEADFLFGPGQQFGYKTEWLGQLAWARVSNTFINARSVKLLEVGTLDSQLNQVANEKARLKTENAE